MATSSRSAFAPLFIVGPGRSGSTMLAVLMDRHSRIAVPPETQFFSKFVPQHWHEIERASRAEKVEAALEFRRIADLELDREAVLARYSEYDDSAGSLLRAILETYTQCRGKQRPAEKSPAHFANIDEIFTVYPAARVVALLRDGRDVVISSMKAGWSHSPRQIGQLGSHWCDVMRIIRDAHRKHPPDRFRVVKFEDIAQDPTGQISALCDFIGEAFEPSQLDPKIETGAVPNWEDHLKAKARTAVDASRIEAWRKHDDPHAIWFMNRLMGKWLRRLGYRDTTLAGCPWFARAKYSLLSIPYWRPLRGIALRALTVMQRLGINPRWGMPR